MVVSSNRRAARDRAPIVGRLDQGWTKGRGPRDAQSRGVAIGGPFVGACLAAGFESQIQRLLTAPTAARSLYGVENDYQRLHHRNGPTNHARVHLQGRLRSPHHRRDSPRSVHSSADPGRLPSRHRLQVVCSADPPDAGHAGSRSAGRWRADRLAAWLNRGLKTRLSFSRDRPKISCVAVCGACPAC